MTLHLMNMNGDRHVYLCEQGPCTHPDPDDCESDYPTAAERGLTDADLFGWLEQGRRMTSVRSNWTEWRFTAAKAGAPAFPVRKSYSAAYEDARILARGGRR